MNRQIVAMTVALVALAACDPQDGAKPQDPQKTAARADTAGQPQDRASHGAAADAAPTKSAGPFTDCLLACDAAKTNHADKAACRSNCEAPGAPASAVATPAVGADPVGYFVGCLDRCTVDGEPSDGCASGCKTAVAGSPAAPKASVLDELGTCLGTCRATKHMNATNHATCALDCTQIARVAAPAPAPAVAAKAPR